MSTADRLFCNLGVLCSVLVANVASGLKKPWGAAPIIPRWNKKKMVQVNWLEWIVLRCGQNWYRWKYKKEHRGGRGGWREGRRLIGEKETFPEKAIKLIDDFPWGMFPQVCCKQWLWRRQQIYVNYILNLINNYKLHVWCYYWCPCMGGKLILI